ncbi:ligase-associated DNA damage response endonuclease PdeM [Gemmobacter denitrificans]|uniref:Ligase-associated DNA damage response endonuclease PdeM n=1 Tax=Gemmobacter denitrificans TaxID=3123040 RepID=A0ABU8BUH0_9RHOB
MDHAFAFAGAHLRAMACGALHWPDQRLLVVSDLHFGKSARLARRGGALLPPYETRETLLRLDQALEVTGAQRVICLGDSFDDLQAEAELEETDRLWLIRLMAGRDWIWIAGNHDPGPGHIGGSHRSDMRLAGLTFRHMAETPGGEVSGHFHPKARLAGQSRPCFLIDGDARLILPAFGAYTGGLWCGATALDAVMGPGALAVLTGPRALPLPYAAACQSSPRSSSLAR